MGTPVIIEAGRTAVGKRGGVFADVHAAKGFIHPRILVEIEADAFVAGD